MSEKYFDNFPNLLYGNTLCKDITRRSIITANNASPYEYYPYEIENHLRSDHIAEYYYGDGMLEWMVQIANENIDPYYGWYNDDDTFLELIREKYGTIENAQLKIKHYINNWADDDTIITKSFYDNTLEEELRKYWEPLYSEGLTIIGYQRKKEDTVQNTNQIWQYTIQANNNGIAFEVGELIDIKVTGSDVVVGRGELEMANSSVFRIKNVSDNVSANSTDVKDFVGKTTTANVSSADGQNWFYNISNTEFVQYSAVSFWDWEQEVNEQKKNIVLVGDGVQAQVSQTFEDLMKADVDPETGLSTG